MQAHYELFKQLNTEVIFIAQLERDPSMLTRISGFVRNEFPIVCDPEQVSRKPYPLFSAYLIDKKGIIQTQVPGSINARPPLSMILKELAKIEGVDTPKLESASSISDSSEEKRESGSSSPTIDPADVLNAQWMWSHDRIAPGDEFKLAFLPVLAEGFHVYANTETKMFPLNIELKLPEEIQLSKPIEYPKPIFKSDPILEIQVAQYEKDIPLSAIQLKAGEKLPVGKVKVEIIVHYQACNDTICYPPTQKTFSLPLEIVGPKDPHRQVSGWKSW